jgi:hypothetical protein
MRTSRSTLLYSVILLLPTFTAAWPWPKFLPDLDSLIVQRDNTNSTSSKYCYEQKRDHTHSSLSDPSTPAPGSATATSGAQQTLTSGTMSITAAPTVSSSSADSSSIPTVTDKTVYDPQLPAGGISMMTPALSSGSQFYRIGDYVTFGWNYTSLLATPTAIDILASCSANNQLYTVAMNQSVSPSGAATWDTGGYQATATVPLLTEKYTLFIYDADSSISAAAQAGYLAPFNALQFGMYLPQAYTPLNDGFQCATCSGALSDMERQALGFMLGMIGITVLSFTWFVRGLDVIW